MQSVISISPAELLELPGQQEEHLMLIGNSSTILNTLRFLPGSNEQPIAVFASNPAGELKVLCEQSSHITLCKEDYTVSNAANYGRVMIVKENLKNALTISGTDDEIAIKLKWLLKDDTANEEKKWKGIATKLIIAFALMVLGHIIISYLPLQSFVQLVDNIKPYFDQQFLFFILTGFLAQMVDGMLSMGYGVTSATCLMSFGISPVSVSAAIHTSEIFTSGISGYSHYKFGNVNKKMFKHLVIPGVIGAILGAVLLVFLGEKGGKWLMPVVALYAMFLGMKILIKAFSINSRKEKVKRIGWLAGVGGFLDSFGGGGWGPIVTSTLVSKGKTPKYTIGSVSLTEFFITLASAATFFVTVGISHWNVVLGLLLGGAVAAPFAAKLAGKLPKKTMMIAVGVMVMIWCLRMIIKSFT
jgi:uncharacterized membrane protein YfcA